MCVIRKSQRKTAKTMMAEKAFREMNHILDNEIEPLVIHLSNSNDSDGNGNELVGIIN